MNELKDENDLLDKFQSDETAINGAAIKLVSELQDAGVAEVTIPISLGAMSYTLTVKLLSTESNKSNH